MVLTKDFKDTIKDRVARNPAFREELLKEGIECLLTGLRSLPIPKIMKAFI